MGQYKKVLIVNDVESNRHVMMQFLEQFGLHVMEAQNGAEAVCIYENDPSFDVVVIDVEIQGMNGFTAARMIRQYQMAKRPFIIGTAATPEHSEKAARSGIDLFVVRSLELDMLKKKFSVVQGRK